MKIKQVKNFSVGLLLVLLTSCSGMEETMRMASDQTKNARDEFARKNPEQTQNNNSNIVKVLNRVSLSEEHKCYDACSEDIKQRSINEIWEKCLNSGFTTSTPNQVASSREIKELVEIPETDVYFKKPGYCIGSEYITK